MTALEDFIAQDPISRDFVNLYSDLRWSEMDVRNRTESILESIFPVQAQRILSRKVDGYTLGKLLELSPDPELPLPAYPLSSAEKAEVQAFGQTSILCGALKDLMWGRAQLLTSALDYEAVRDWLSTLPPVEEGQPDPSADLRAALQAQLDAASPGTLALVADRDAWRASQQMSMAASTEA